MEKSKHPKPRKAVRILIVAILSLAGLCVVSLATFAVINATLPDASSNPQALSSEQIALMDEALHLKAELGSQVWPGFGEAEIPLLVWNESYAFLCVHPQPPQGWEQLNGIRVGGGACFRKAWENPQNFTESIGGYWTGELATREWALIELRRPFSEMLPVPVRTVAPIFLLVNEMMTPYRYIGGEVHELFHAYQAISMQDRFKDTDLAYPMSTAYWKVDPQMNQAWTEEIDTLYQAVRANNDAESKKLASKFLELRAARRQAYLQNSQLVLYEQRYEWLEGQAKYIELQILKAANETPGYKTIPTLVEDTSFRGYGGIEQLLNQEMDQMKRQATIEGDTRFYYTGYSEALLLDRWMPDWKTRVAEPGVWLDDLLASALVEVP